MGQYRLWLHHRGIDQHLRGQQIIYEQELAVIDERITRIEKTARQTKNALLTALMQHLYIQEQPTNKLIATRGTQSEYNAATQESTNSKQYQTPPLSNYGQQSIPTSPPLSAWSQLLNLNAQELPLSDKPVPPAETVPLRPEEFHSQSANDPHTYLKQDHQKNALPPLPWWLRNLTQNDNEEQETQEMAPIDEQSTPTDPSVERQFARRTRLIHYIQKPNSQS
jgi:hypothetical protein